MKFTISVIRTLRKLCPFFLLVFSPLLSFTQNKTVGLTKHLNGGDENGYILFTPMSTDTTYLINKCGKRVHSWYSQYTPGLSVYLKPNGNLLKTGTYTDTVFGFAGGRGGIIEEYKWDGTLEWRYKLFNDSLCQHHDITPLPNGNILVLAWHTISKSKAIAYGRKNANFGPFQNELWGERIIELKPIGKDSAAIVWQWDLFDHIVQDDDSTKPNYGAISSNPGLLNINYALNLQTNDWIHANSLDYNADLDQIVISCHNISEIWVIDHSTTKKQAGMHSGGNSNKGGDFLYRWGNPAAYDKGSMQDRKLFRQHNAHWIPKGNKDSGSIMIFNNGWDRDTAYSSIDIIKTPVFSNGSYNNTLPYGPGKQSWIYTDSIVNNFYSQIISGAQRLPNGNTLICSGVQGKFFEVNANKKTVWEYINPRNGNRIQKDGETPGNNAVFRCTYYPETYSAFNGRNLSPKGTIELNPFVYSCNFETIPPQVTSVSPANKSQGVNPSSVLKLTFSESVLAKTGTVSIYQNNLLYETISVPGNKVTISNNVVTITHAKLFDLKARIGIGITKNAFRDSSNNLSPRIDTASWHFNTIDSRPGVIQYLPAHNSVNAPINGPLTIVFDRMVSKANLGEIIIWENSLQKEKILIGNGSIVVNGNIVKITPSSPFAFNANIVIEAGPCFIDSNGISNNAGTFGDWTFRTISTLGIVSLSPTNNSSNIATNASVSITFDRPVKIENGGSLMIYENKILKDSIRVDGPRAMISGNSIFFDLNSDFKKSARVAILLKAGVLSDTFGATFGGIDSANWHFSTVKSGVNLNSFRYKDCSLYPNPGNGRFILTGIDLSESIEVINMAGQTIHYTKYILNDHTVELALKDAVAGLYVLRVAGLRSFTFINQ